MKDISFTVSTDNVTIAAAVTDVVVCFNVVIRNAMITDVAFTCSTPVREAGRYVASAMQHAIGGSNYLAIKLLLEHISERRDFISLDGDKVVIVDNNSDPAIVATTTIS